MENRYFTRLALTAAAALAAGLAVSTPLQAGDAGAHHMAIPADEMTFQPGPGTLPEGVRFTVLEGSPAEAGPFVIRLEFPAGYAIPPHMHPEEEHVTVISGRFGIGTGDVFDKTAVKVLEAGGFVRIPTGMSHFAWVEDGAVVQINAMGPFGITYVNAEEDPRIN